jgi:hypothetical protein
MITATDTNVPLDILVAQLLTHDRNFYREILRSLAAIDLANPRRA